MLYRTPNSNDATVQQVNAARAEGQTVYRSANGNAWIPWIPQYKCWEDELSFDNAGKPTIQHKA